MADIIIGRDKTTLQLILTLSNGQGMVYAKSGKLPRTVAERHCSLQINGSQIRLRNLDQSFSTYVNGRAVVTKTINVGDKIELGLDRFPLSWDALSAFVVDIQPLGQIWDEYDRHRLDQQIADRRFNSLRSATGLITMGAIALSILTGRQSPWFIVLYVAAIALSVYFTVKAYRNASAVPQKLRDLESKFQQDYVCPHCGHFLGNQSYQLLKQNGYCQYCKTQFIH